MARLLEYVTFLLFIALWGGGGSWANNLAAGRMDSWKALIVEDRDANVNQFHDNSYANSVYSLRSVEVEEEDAPSSVALPSPLHIKCTRSGPLENPLNCAKFYNCVKFGPDFQLFSLNCVGGTVFYPPRSKCVSPTSIGQRAGVGCHSSSAVTAAGGGVAVTTGRPGESVEVGEEWVDDDAVGLSDGPPPEEVELNDGPPMDEYANEFEEYGLDLDPPPANLLDLFTPHDSSSKNYSRTLHARTSNMEEFEYDDERIGISLLHGQQQPAEFHSDLPPMKNRLRPPPPPPPTTHPKVWFGFRSKDSPHPISNPFKDDETTLAVILDFATSRLQIYSKNKPPR